MTGMCPVFIWRQSGFASGEGVEKVFPGDKGNPPYPLVGVVEKPGTPDLSYVTDRRERKITPPLRVWLPEGKARRGSRAFCAKADSVGGKMRFIASPNYTPHRIAFGLTPSALRLAFPSGSQTLKGGVNSFLIRTFSTPLGRLVQRVITRRPAPAVFRYASPYRCGDSSSAFRPSRYLPYASCVVSSQRSGPRL